MLSAFKTFLKPREKQAWSFNEGSSQDVGSLGIKGANLCEVYRLGLPTPAGFIVDAEASVRNPVKDLQTPLQDSLMVDIRKHISDLESKTSKTFGSTNVNNFPLLLAIRASSSIQLPNLEAGTVGAGVGVAIKRQDVLPDSWLIPGVSSTALNVGINDDICKAIAQRAGSRFAYDTHARFLLYYGVIVHNHPPEKYFKALKSVVEASGRDRLLVSDLHEVIKHFKAIQLAPEDPFEQVISVVKAIYSKWHSEEATNLRYDILGARSSQGVAVIMSSMVFGNLSSNSGSGFMLSRSPMDGTKQLQVEYLSASEGEDVIVSRRTPVNAAYLKVTHTIIYEQLEECVDHYLS